MAKKEENKLTLFEQFIVGIVLIFVSIFAKK